MKKFISCLSAGIMIFSCFSFAVLAAENDGATIVSDNADTKIITSESLTETQLGAARTLQKYIEEITGKKLEILSSAENFNGHKIFVGKTEKEGVSVPNLPDRGYILREKNGDLYIAGSDEQWNIRAVYGFLEKYCSCRWYTDEIKLIPKAETIKAPKDLDYTYKPFFVCGSTDWSYTNEPEYMAANGLDKRDEYISRFCHTLTTQFCSSETYFAEHPEYFALHKGKRTPNQLCLTNPDVLDIVVKEALDIAKEKHDPSKQVQIISLTQHDNDDYCTCEKCKELDNANGSHAGAMVSFANAVAKKIKEAGYDNIAIDTFAYRYTRKPPALVKPDDNVIIRLCSIECCFCHSLNDPDCRDNAEFMKDLTDWSKICDRIYVWDYTANFREPGNIYPNFRVLQSNIQTFLENGVKGLFEEGLASLDKRDMEFGRLKAYLLAKFMQDPYNTDYDTEMNGFLKTYYGDGWENIRKYIDFICEKAKNSHMGIEQNSKKTLKHMKKAEIEYCNSLFEKAKALAQSDVYIQRIERSELSWRYWKCVNKKDEFSRLLSCRKWMSAQKKFYDDISAFGVTRLVGWVKPELTTCATAYLLRTAEKWNKKYETKLLFWIEPYVVKFYNRITDLN